MSDTYLSGGLMSVLWSRIKNLVSTKENKFSVLSIDKGGTGGSTSEEAMTNLISSLPKFSGAYYNSYMHYPVYCAPDDEDPERMGYQTLADLLTAVNNRSNKVSTANTSYATFMARGIAVTSSIPSSMANGTAVFIY